MKHVSWLVRLAVLVWVTWLGLVGLMLGLLRLRVWHPHFLPVVSLFTALLGRRSGPLGCRCLATDPRPQAGLCTLSLAPRPGTPGILCRAYDVRL